MNMTFQSELTDIKHSIKYSVLSAMLLLMTLMSLSVHSDEDKALVFKTEGEAFNEVLKGITDDLEEDLIFVPHDVTKATTPDDIGAVLKKTSPQIVILIGNEAINAYTRFQNESGQEEFPPSLAIAALFVDKLVSNINNATGIRYEIPAVTSIVNMRSMLDQRVKRVGVIYREWMKDFIEENQTYCQSEGIELVTKELPNKSKKMPKLLAKGIKELMKKKVDAFWIINDNALLNRDALLKAWIPSLKKAKQPVIVGVDSLLATKLNFGSYAIVPDHYALGVQGASAIAEIMDEDWSLEDRDIEQPLSVKKLMNISIMKKKGAKIKPDALNKIDTIIK